MAGEHGMAAATDWRLRPSDSIIALGAGFVGCPCGGTRKRSTHPRRLDDGRRELHGILLYDPEGYAATRLGHLRRLLETHGLHREVNRRDLIWRWRQFPGFDWSLEWEAAA